jgi:hypothetical protein
MCCDGTLFARARITADEVEGAADLGMSVLDPDQNGNLSFRQPCHLLRGTACSVYEDWRPDICSGYTCRVLDSYLDGTRSLEESKRLIAQVRQAAADAASAQPRVMDVASAAAHDLLAVATFEALKVRLFKNATDADG